jgi:hypothetical protein
MIDSPRSTTSGTGVSETVATDSTGSDTGGAVSVTGDSVSAEATSSSAGVSIIEIGSE